MNRHAVCVIKVLREGYYMTSQADGQQYCFHNEDTKL